MAVTNKLNPSTRYVELEGESIDDKPQEGIAVNSKFYELDTGDIYYWDGSAWTKVGSSGSSPSGGDS